MNTSTKAMSAASKDATPRTIGLLRSIDCSGPWYMHSNTAKLREHAETLERENQSLREQLAALAKLRDEHIDLSLKYIARCELHRQAEAEMARLRAAGDGGGRTLVLRRISTLASKPYRDEGHRCDYRVQLEAIKQCTDAHLTEKP